jgi:carboxypeptidase C (cathepsin A)
MNPLRNLRYTAYVDDSKDKAKRPILFAYNGGPGSASLWLHMGILGLVRVVVDDLAFNTTGPFRRTNNEYSILVRADLVMVDPVDTGFSRPIGETKGKKFWASINISLLFQVSSHITLPIMVAGNHLSIY